VKIEGLFSSMYTYYIQSPKKTWNAPNWLIESRGLKILKNIQTQWISMLTSFKQLSCEYKSLVMNMSNDLPTNPVTTTNFELLCDVEMVMELTNVLQSSPKFEQTYSKPKIASFVILWQ
jgi:hypothetical protein